MQGEKIDFALVNAERLRREPQSAILNEHRHLHGLAELGEVDCAELERIHTLVVDEMTRRGLEHSSPLVCGEKYSPSQPRDEHGRFGSGGSSVTLSGSLFGDKPGSINRAKFDAHALYSGQGSSSGRSAYATSDAQAAREYAEREVIEAGGSQLTNPGEVNKVYYNPKNELNLEGLGPTTSASNLERALYKDGILKEVKPGGGDWLAQKVGVRKFGDEQAQTWRYLEHDYVQGLIRDAGKDGVRFVDVSRGRNHPAAFSLGGPLMTWNDIQSAKGKSFEGKPGLKLNEPHAYLVWKGKKKSIALPADDGKGLDGHLVGVPLVLCQNGAAGAEAYGEAILGNPAAMTPAQFDLPEYADCHCVRPEERREWWSEVKQFYVYPIKSFAKYDKPRPVQLQEGCKCYLPDVRFKQYTPPTDKERVILAQSDKLPKQIILTPRAVSLTGSMLYGNHEPRDVDVVVVGAEWREDEGQFVVPLTPTFKEKLERVLRAVYQTGNAVQYISEHEGPTFDHLPLYALALVRLPRLEVEHVSEMEPDTAELAYDKDGAKALTATAVERELRGASPTVRRQALQSYTDDAVVPGRPFVPLKPMRPAKEGQRQVFSRFADYVESLESWPEYVSAKRDGMRVTFHRRDGKVTAYSDDGKNTTSTLPELVKRLEEIKGGDYVLDSEVELWRDEGGGQHYPREAASGAIHSGEGTADLIANVFDVLYWDGKDLHKQPFVERLKVLNALPSDTKSDDALRPSKGLLNVIPHYPVKDRAELEKLCMRTAYKPGVEGVVVKRADGDYPLDGDPGEPPVWVKFHKSVSLTVTVLSKTETETPGVYNYEYGIEL